MLKSIEISGFKSFADTTRMEFAEGISALVGPNGSGKSNIVDAIKWALGEQSMKKLRSGESTDVIFGGSATRGPMGSAEVTLTFSNENHTFPIDAKEVHITRRVYRSGEGEYLINRQASRLKTIRDMICGTGLGSHAYSIIEQGRVEALLQSTAPQRRTIIEEAAGISLFTAKKQETERRLERVRQNLLRLSDIVNEVEGQLRDTKSQAGKAQLHRQYTTRLRELRIRVAHIEWNRGLSDKERFESELAVLTEREKNMSSELEQAENDLTAINAAFDKNDQEMRRIGNESAAIRERISADESTRNFHIDQTEQLQNELIEHGQRLLDLNVRNGDAESMMQKTNDDIFEEQRHRREISDSLDKENRDLEHMVAEYSTLAEQEDELRKAIQEYNVEIGRLLGELTGQNSTLQSLEISLTAKSQERDRLNKDIQKIPERRGKLNETLDQMKQEIESLRENLVSLQTKRENDRNELEKTRNELAALRLSQKGLTERTSVLKDLLKKHEGLSPGVRQVLSEKSNEKSPFRFVHGMVAELVRVNVDAAPLIELALGESAQDLVATADPELLDHIEKHSADFVGRVGFRWLDSHLNRPAPWRNVNYENLPGVIGRADQFVETDPEFEPLIERLLAKTWIVESFEDAKRLNRQGDGSSDFLTLAGECLAGDGTLLVGPPHAGSGLISRRSEFRELTQRLLSLESEIEQKKNEVANVDARKKSSEHKTQNAEQELKNAEDSFDAFRIRQTATVEKDNHLQENFTRLETELQSMKDSRALLLQQLESMKTQQNELKEQISTAEKKLDDTRLKKKQLATQRQKQTRVTSNLNIELAKSEERLDSLNEKMKQFQETRLERIRMLQEHSERYKSLRNRRDTSELAALRTESQLATLYARKEFFAVESAGITKEHARLTDERKRANSRMKKSNTDSAKVHDQVHRISLEIERLIQEQSTIERRMKEDYGIDSDNGFLDAIDIAVESSNLAANTDTIDNDNTTNDQVDSDTDTTESTDVTQSQKQPEKETFEEMIAALPEYQKEIDELKTKLNKMGSVNLEAIETLESLESRYTKLFNYYNDVLTAKRNIHKTIERINNDSKRLFEQTFESVRIYFCDIFQKLFGGGHADLVLENPDAPLESGVEIVACPPGKDLKSIMLLSGGEKTLTCVALLLAIFRYRSNPICILDEVDAPLDEANQGRFVKILQNLQTETQFLIITHSRKTMTCAKTMYGVTMQDSGVSRLLAIQFNDVGEHGEILIQGKGRSPDPVTNSSEGGENVA